MRPTRAFRIRSISSRSDCAAGEAVSNLTSLDAPERISLEDGGTGTAAARRARVLAGPVVIEARDVRKTFRIPHHRVDSLKERAAHPLTRQGYRELDALRGLSFDVHKG